MLPYYIQKINIFNVFLPSLQAVHNIPEICARHDIKHAVISPGSRSAPLTIAFARHPQIKCTVAGDERSAAFIALGMAIQSGSPVVLICTSGSAVLNYYPAVAEAFYQKIPLLILTADRPPEWIDQMDGQTIRQNEVYGNHVKASYTFPESYQHIDSVWYSERILSEAILTTRSYPAGPVHINIPLREPFYPDQPIEYSQDIKIIKTWEAKLTLSREIIAELDKTLESTASILIIAGQHTESLSPGFHKSLRSFTEKYGAVLLAEPLSNCQNTDTCITSFDLILSNVSNEEALLLKPELIITFGDAIVSKSLKHYIRTSAPLHWHIQPGGKSPDLFQCLTNVIPIKAGDFFSMFEEKPRINKSYPQLWNHLEKKYTEARQRFFERKNTLSELTAIHEVIHAIPEKSIVHISNSMPIRYISYTGLGNKGLKAFCNRGTSGIDGVISTAAGAASVTDQFVTVITGDMAFFYDRNALWNTVNPSNLRIVILNNHGGGIFRMIEGPDRQPELEKYFVTDQPHSAVGYAYENNLDYYFCKDLEILKQQLKNFYQPSEYAKILEIETNPVIDKETLKEYKNIANHDK